jgi:hypothetical protein
VERTRCVASVNVVCRECVWCVSCSCLADLWFSSCLFSRRVRLGLSCVWHASGSGLLRVSGVCLVRVWRVSGSCLVRVWYVSVFCESGACLARVWSVSGALRLRGGRVQRAWCVATVTYVYRERVWCAYCPGLAHLLFSGGVFSSLARVGLSCVWRVSGACLARVWRASDECVFRVSGACLARVWLVSGASLVRVVFLCVWRVSEACLEGVWRVEPAWRACGTYMARRDSD